MENEDLCFIPDIFFVLGRQVLDLFRIFRGMFQNALFSISCATTFSTKLVFSPQSGHSILKISMRQVNICLKNSVAGLFSFFLAYLTYISEENTRSRGRTSETFFTELFAKPRHIYN